MLGAKPADDRRQVGPRPAHELDLDLDVSLPPRRAPAPATAGRERELDAVEGDLGDGDAAPPDENGPALDLGHDQRQERSAARERAQALGEIPGARDERQARHALEQAGLLGTPAREAVHGAESLQRRLELASPAADAERRPRAPQASPCGIEVERPQPHGRARHEPIRSERRPPRDRVERPFAAGGELGFDLHHGAM